MSYALICSTAGNFFYIIVVCRVGNFSINTLMQLPQCRCYSTMAVTHNHQRKSTPLESNKNLNINIQQPVKMIHFQELNSLIYFMDGQEMGGSFHILLLKAQLLCKGFYCPNPSLISNCKRKGNTIYMQSFKTERIPARLT